MDAPTLRFKDFNEKWSVNTLKEITIGLDYGMNAAAKSFDGENQYIRITDIDDNSRRYIMEKPVSPEGELSDNYLLEEGDILFARTGASTGKSYLYKLTDGKMYFAGFLIRARLNKDVVSKFIYLQTLTKRFNDWVKIMSMRSGQPGINAKEYGEFTIQLASRDEQLKIADFFTLLDQRIEKQREKIELLQSQKKRLMQKIFSQELRFKDANGKEYAEWSINKLGKLTKKVGPKNKNNKEYPVCSINNKVGFILQSEQFEDSRLDLLDKTAYKIVNKNEFAYNPARINVGSFGLQKNHDKVIVSSLYVCFSTLSELLPYYLEQYMNTPNFNKEVKINLEGSVREYLFYENFSNIRIPVPSIEEQEKIVRFLSVFDDKISKEVMLLQILEFQKNGLMQQMFI